MTGQLSVPAQPWLVRPRRGRADRAAGYALVEMVVRAGDEVGCGRVEELLIVAPLVLPERAGVRVQSPWTSRTMPVAG